MLSTFSTTLAKAAADVSERVAGEIEEFKNEAARREEWEAESVRLRRLADAQPAHEAVATSPLASPLLSFAHKVGSAAQQRVAAEWEDFASEKARCCGSREWDGSGTTPACYAAATATRGEPSRAPRAVPGSVGDAARARREAEEFAAKLEIAAAETEPPDLEAEPAAVATAATTPAGTPAAAPATAEASSCPDAARPADATDAVPPALAASDGAAEEWGGSVEAAAAAAAAAAAGGGGGGGSGDSGDGSRRQVEGLAQQVEALSTALAKAELSSRQRAAASRRQLEAETERARAAEAEVVARMQLVSEAMAAEEQAREAASCARKDLRAVQRQASARIKALCARGQALEEELAQLSEEGEMTRSRMASLQQALAVLQREQEAGARHASETAAKEQYLRTLVIRYLELEEEHEALFPALATCLQLTPEEVSRIHLAQHMHSHRNSLWGQAMSAGAKMFEVANEVQREVQIYRTTTPGPR